MSNRLDELDPLFLERVKLFLIRLDAAGIKYVVWETRRNLRDQQDAFRRGASKRDGVKLISMHQAGLAIDVVPLDSDGKPTWDYAKYADIYKHISATSIMCGLESGANWPPVDPKTGLGWDAPHHEFKG